MFIQELIQNAEDAGASDVKFLYDKHTYGTAHLYDEELAQFQVDKYIAMSIIPFLSVVSLSLGEFDYRTNLLPVVSLSLPPEREVTVLDIRHLDIVPAKGVMEPFPHYPVIHL